VTRAFVANRSEWLAHTIRRLVVNISRHWISIFLLLYGVFVGLPWLAPWFMHSGHPAAGRLIYALYSLTNHQYPERSVFLYGSQVMYTVDQIDPQGLYRSNPVHWRQFAGNEALGWKVAWSDRAVSMYTTIWLGAAGFSLVRRRLRSLSGRLFLVLLLPMMIDGGTHLINDLLGASFRQTNGWLAFVTGNTLPMTFYAGDRLGSFNSIVRLSSGFLFGIAVAWFVLPILESAFRNVVEQNG
jgi:uncharacterized membrane protein